MIKFWNAAVLAAIFMVPGASLEGQVGRKTLQGLWRNLDLDILLYIALIAAGSYAAYALGANNIANVTAVL